MGVVEDIAAVTNFTFFFFVKLLSPQSFYIIILKNVRNKKEEHKKEYYLSRLKHLLEIKQFFCPLQNDIMTLFFATTQNFCNSILLEHLSPKLF